MPVSRVGLCHDVAMMKYRNDVLSILLGNVHVHTLCNLMGERYDCMLSQHEALCDTGVVVKHTAWQVSAEHELLELLQ